MAILQKKMKEHGHETLRSMGSCSGSPPRQEPTPSDSSSFSGARRNRQQQNRLCSLLILVISLSIIIPETLAFSVSTPPIFGLGALLFPPKDLSTSSANGDTQTLLKASEFFVDAFWTGKVGGGAKALTPRQRQTLGNTQFMEFRSRYAGRNVAAQSDLIVCRQGDSDEVIGCCGLEVTNIPTIGDLKAQENLIRAPLMSNVAVSRNFRRRGIAEKMVAQAEEVARKQWGYDQLLLYVEQRNTPAVKLYKKLGYRTWWTDKNAKTLLPTANGNLQNADTTIVCMRKRLDRGVLGRLLPF